MSRRFVLGTVAAGLVAGRSGWSRAQGTRIPADIELKVSREGSDIGLHNVRFIATEDGFEAHSAVDLEVKFALFTFFSYHQRSVDHWVDGKLVKSVGTCIEDGEKTVFEAWVEDGQLMFDGKAGRSALPLGAMTDLSFWNPNILGTPHVIDAQTAEVDPMKVNHLGIETISVAGVELETNRYFAASGDRRNGDIWYDASSRWVKAAFNTRGELLDYDLIR